MTAPCITTPTQGREQTQMKLPLAVHLACILLLIAVTACTGPLATFFA